MFQHISLHLEAENLNLRTADLIVSQTIDCKSSGFHSSKGSASGKENQKEGMNSYTGPGLSCNWTDRHVTDVMQCGDTVMKRASLISHVQPEVCSTPVACREGNAGKNHSKGWAGQVPPSKGSKQSRSSAFLPVDPSSPYALGQRWQEAPPEAEPGWRNPVSVCEHILHIPSQSHPFSHLTIRLVPLEDTQQRTHFPSPALLRSP